MNTPLDKAALRTLARQQRQALSPAERAAYSRRICEQLLALPEMEAAATVMSYCARPEEAALSALHETLWARGKRLCFPVTQERGGMEAMPCGPEGPWKEGSFGIREPEGKAFVSPAEIDLIILPCVAFDETGTRLGWGGGYYDRYLARGTEALRIGAAFEVQRMAALPRAQWDVPLSLLVTEEGVWRFV